MAARTDDKSFPWTSISLSSCYYKELKSVSTIYTYPSEVLDPFRRLYSLTIHRQGDKYEYDSNSTFRLSESSVHAKEKAKDKLVKASTIHTV